MLNSFNSLKRGLATWTVRQQENQEQARRFLSALPFRAKLTIYGAIFSTFAGLGFAIDLLQLERLHPLSRIAGTSLVSGLVAVGLLWSATQRLRWLWVAVPLSILVNLAAAGLLPSRPEKPPFEGTQAQLYERAAFDSAGLLFCTMLGYSLFITFISRQGVRQLRLQTEIDLARELHATLVPSLSGQTNRIAFEGFSNPSAEVGGDLIDVWEGNGQTFAYLVDVSGHGVSAGAFMGIVKGVLRTEFRTGGRLCELLTRVNASLGELSPPNMFFTLAGIRIDDEGQTEFCSAGHPPVLHFSRESGKVARLAAQNTPLGLFPQTTFKSEPITLRPGDRLVLLTDGLLEVQEPRGRELGLEPFIATLHEHDGRPLPQLIQKLRSLGRGTIPAHDDQSALIIERL